jgi:putative ABC transport system permease protein
MNLLLELKEGALIAWDAFRTNKMRSVLTTLGIIIGIVTVTLMGTAIDGINDAFKKGISGIGANVLFVERRNWIIETSADWERQRKRREITRDQVRALQRKMTMAECMAPVVSMGQPISYKSSDASGVRVIGTTSDYASIAGFGIAEGRFMTELEADAGRPVCIIGTNICNRLFANESAIGKQVRLGRQSLEVIGVVEKQGTFLGLPSVDDNVIIPLQQVLMWYTRYPDYQIQVKVASVEDVPAAREELRAVMRRIRHVQPGDPDDFAINQQEQIVAVFDRVAGTIGLVALLITGLSLFVGGIGIMNIMFVSVAERTREIGVRKAIGAKNRTILLQFLMEAALICLLGGLVGMGLTYALSFAVAKVLPVKVSISVMGLAILVSLLTGLVSGFLPAWRAARMNPVDALRNE